MASFGAAKASNPRKSYFHQFAKVFSLESFPLYGNVDVVSGGGTHQNSPSSSNFIPILFFSFWEIWLHSLDLTREGVGWGKKGRGGGKEKKEKDEKDREEEKKERERERKGKWLEEKKGGRGRGSPRRNKLEALSSCFCPKLWNFKCTASGSKQRTGAQNLFFWSGIPPPSVYLGRHWRHSHDKWTGNSLHISMQLEGSK